MSHTCYIDFQCSIQSLSGERLLLVLKDSGTEGKQLNLQAWDANGTQVQTTEQNSKDAFIELRKCLFNFLP